MSIYDEYISGYKDWSPIVSAEHATKLIALDNALTAIIVVNGQIIGTWKRTFKKSRVVITTDIFTALTEAEHQAVVTAAHHYGASLWRIPWPLRNASVSDIRTEDASTEVAMLSLSNNVVGNPRPNNALEPTPLGGEQDRRDFETKKQLDCFPDL